MTIKTFSLMNSLASFTSMCVYRYFNVLAYGKSLNNYVIHMHKKAIHYRVKRSMYKALNRKKMNNKSPAGVGCKHPTNNLSTKDLYKTHVIIITHKQACLCHYY